MPIEAAVRQAGSGHHFGHADPVEAAFAKHPGGAVKNLFAMCLGFNTGNSGHRKEGGGKAAEKIDDRHHLCN